ncbi:MAG: hypothetical protein R3313_01115, partial [Candidatus Saccharimonadales bacterium]|nr:hypothetical protein [Candidatus Saccharimonadales bacterium]
LLPIDQFRFKRYINKLNAKGYDYLLSDRYFYDSAVNIVYLGGSKNVLKRTFPPTEASFFLNVNPEEIMSRERAPGQGIEYLKTKNTLYAQLMKHQNMTPIDGSEDPTTINQTIIQRL